jgi:hypothetical protein
MQYLPLVFLAERRLKPISRGHCPAYGVDPAAGGPRCVGAHLYARIDNGDILVTDGPFVETKEYLAGSR